MAIFGEKKNDEQPQLQQNAAVHGGSSIIQSRQYRLFKKKSEEKFTWYEMLARFAGNIFSVQFDKKTAEDLKAAIAFTGLRIKPQSPFSLFLLSTLFFTFASVMLYGVRLIQNEFGIAVSVALGLGVGYYLMMYPKSLMKSMRIQASSEVVLAILYMVVSMRISPNIERAVSFSASNIKGPLAWDLRKLLWDIEMGRYYSANEALIDYINKWKAENEEFSESLHLIMESQKQTPEKGEKTLDEALRVVLEGTRDRMKHYAQDLQMPVTMIHMMGVVLPILGSVMAPMAAVFLGDPNMAIYLILSYDIALPVLLLWFINNTLKKRPVTFSKIDISNHPNLPPKGTFLLKLGKSRVSLPAIPIAILVAFLIMVPGILHFVSHPDYLIVPMVQDSSGNMAPVNVDNPDPLFTLLMSMLIVIGVAAGLGLYFFLTNIQRSRLEDSVYKMESEFELALFQLGNRISGGTPIELAIEKAADDVKDMEISNLFNITLRNMRNFNMTFEKALLNPQAGAIRFYPSRLIQNVMRAITDTSKKGVQFASQSMLTVSKYLKNIRETQEYMKTLLSETTSSMQFQGYAMAPLVSGLIVAMSQVIIQVLAFLGGRLNEFGFSDTFGVDPSQILGSSSTITPSMFQLIVGVYLVEIIIILALFITKVSRGDDSSAQWNLAGKMLLVGLIVYMLVAVGSSLMFSGMIQDALSTLTST